MKRILDNTRQPPAKETLHCHTKYLLQLFCVISILNEGILGQIFWLPAKKDDSKILLPTYLIS